MFEVLKFCVSGVIGSLGMRGRRVQFWNFSFCILETYLSSKGKKVFILAFSIDKFWNRAVEKKVGP